MTGSLQTKGTMYYAVVYLPDETGKYKPKWISTGITVEGNNKRKANARLREIVVELEHQKITYSQNIAFLKWIDQWMNEKANSVRRITLESYEHYVKTHIAPFFEPFRLSLREVSPQHIQNYYNKKSKSGLSACSIHKHSVVIRGGAERCCQKKHDSL